MQLGGISGQIVKLFGAGNQRTWCLHWRFPLPLHRWADLYLFFWTLPSGTVLGTGWSDNETARDGLADMDGHTPDLKSLQHNACIWDHKYQHFCPNVPKIHSNKYRGDWGTGVVSWCLKQLIHNFYNRKGEECTLVHVQILLELIFDETMSRPQK